MTDKELIDLSNLDLFPFEKETDEEFFERINQTSQRFSFCYSKKNLRFYELACTLIDEGNAVVELNPIFLKQKSFLGVTVEEIIDHEKVHFHRRGFRGNKFEESLAYYLSKSRFRKIFGAYFRTPYESLSVLIGSLVIPFCSWLDFFSSESLILFVFLLIILGVRSVVTFFRIQSLIKKLDLLFNQNGFKIILRLSEKEILMLHDKTQHQIKRFFEENRNLLRVKQILLAFLK